MNRYTVYVGGVLFSGGHKATSEPEMIRQIKDQIENLWPLNMSADNVEAYRDRFRGQEVTVKYLYKV